MNAVGTSGTAIEVLLVEDHSGDVRLMQEAFRDSNRAIHLHVATDGVEAMAFLRREQDVAKRSHDFARPVDRLLRDRRHLVGIGQPPRTAPREL